MWLAEVKAKAKRKNWILFSKEVSNQPLPSGGVDSVISYDCLLRYSILPELPLLLQ